MKLLVLVQQNTSIRIFDLTKFRSRHGTFQFENRLVESDATIDRPVHRLQRDSISKAYEERSEAMVNSKRRLDFQRETQLARTKANRKPRQVRDREKVDAEARIE